jgi:hypothetical protein
VVYLMMAATVDVSRLPEVVEPHDATPDVRCIDPRQAAQGASQQLAKGQLIADDYPAVGMTGSPVLAIEQHEVAGKPVRWSSRTCSASKPLWRRV